MANRNIKKVKAWLETEKFESQAQKDLRLNELKEKYPVSFKKATKGLTNG